MGIRYEDLTGMKFGRLTVVERSEDFIEKSGKHRTQFRCVCDCGKNDNVIVLAKLLKNHHVQSCGCLKSERVARFNKETKSKPNKIEVVGDVAILYTTKGEQIFIDSEDLPKVDGLCWYINSDGYVVSTFTSLKDSLKLHRVIMNCPDDMMVDHIGGSEWLYDNRKCNLRIVTASQNQMNRKLNSSNTSGHHGVCWDKQCKKWRASITVNGKWLNLGLFCNIDDCIDARKAAEKQYYQEYAYDYSQSIYQNPLV